MRGFSHELRSHLRAQVADESSYQARELAGFRAFVQFTREHPELYPIVMESQFVDLEIYREYYDSWRNSYVRALERAQRAGEIRAVNLTVAAYMLMGLGHFLGLDAFFWREATASESSFEDAVDIITRGLGPDRRAGGG